MTFHNINVSGGVVGAINTGQAQNIDVAIGQIRQAGAKGLAQSLQQFTEAVLSNKDLEEQARQEVVEQLFFVTDQVRTAPEQRRPGMIKTALGNIQTAVSVSTGCSISGRSFIHTL